jgi:hypothetical protein
VAKPQILCGRMAGGSALQGRFCWSQLSTLPPSPVAEGRRKTRVCFPKGRKKRALSRQEGRKHRGGGRKNQQLKRENIHMGSKHP